MISVEEQYIRTYSANIMFTKKKYFIFVILSFKYLIKLNKIYLFIFLFPTKKQERTKRNYFNNLKEFVTFEETIT